MYEQCRGLLIIASMGLPWAFHWPSIVLLPLTASWLPPRSFFRKRRGIIGLRLYPYRPTAAFGVQPYK